MRLRSLSAAALLAATLSGCIGGGRRVDPARPLEFHDGWWTNRFEQDGEEVSTSEALARLQLSEASRDEYRRLERQATWSVVLSLSAVTAVAIGISQGAQEGGSNGVPALIAGLALDIPALVLAHKMENTAKRAVEKYNAALPNAPPATPAVKATPFIAPVAVGGDRGVVVGAAARF